uniref:Uncharacterized protein n=1 Tax=Arundo donax TaxID=35708 RepID=A0A0A9CF64_ARUDO
MSPSTHVHNIDIYFSHVLYKQKKETYIFIKILN